VQGTHEDDVAQRQAQLHQALSNRCAELRVQLLPPAANLSP
jgi:hypothetical protein